MRKQETAYGASTIREWRMQMGKMDFWGALRTLHGMT